jgi:hypothetical protein
LYCAYSGERGHSFRKNLEIGHLRPEWAATLRGMTDHFAGITGSVPPEYPVLRLTSAFLSDREVIIRLNYLALAAT